MTTPGSTLRLGAKPNNYTAVVLRDGAVLAVKADGKACKTRYASALEWMLSTGLVAAAAPGAKKAEKPAPTDAERLRGYLRKNVTGSAGKGDIYIYASRLEQLANYKSFKALDYWAAQHIARLEAEIAKDLDSPQHAERRVQPYGVSHVMVILDGVPSALYVGRVKTAEGVPAKHALEGQFALCFNGRVGASFAEVGIPAGTPLWSTLGGTFRRLEDFA